MLMIRLMRTGKKNRPFFRVVVQESKKKSNGVVLDLLGTFDPIKTGPAKIDREKMNKWIAQGAKVSPTVKSLASKAQKAATA